MAPRRLCTLRRSLLKLARLLAEEAGFEPASPCGPVVFKTTAFSLSATPPCLCSSTVSFDAAS